MATNAICPNSMGEAACSAVRAAAGFFSVQRQLRLNRWQPKRLHQCVQREVFPQVLRQGLGSRRIARHGKRKRGSALHALTRRSQLQSLCRCPPGLHGIAESSFLHSIASQIAAAVSLLSTRIAESTARFVSSRALPR